MVNHTGPYHVWADDPPTPTWFNGTVKDHISNNWQKWTTMNPRATYQTQRRNLDGWFVDILPDLNQNDPEVARYIIQNTLWWIGETGIDAIRQDTWQYVPNAFWHKWTAAIKSEYPNVIVVGEVKDGDVAHTSFFQGGKVRFDGVDSGLEERNASHFPSGLHRGEFDDCGLVVNSHGARLPSIDASQTDEFLRFCARSTFVTT